MSNIDAFRASVTGMNAQATKLSAISNNIANSSTIGFKRTDTQFESLVLGGPMTSSAAMAGTRAVNRMEISKAGQIQATSSATDIAISGSGYLVVNQNADDTGAYLATRAGSFQPDAQGNLRNTAGYYLQGVPVDATGVPTASAGTTLAGLQTVNVANVAIPATATSAMTYWANLPAAETVAGAAGSASTSTVDYFDALGTPQTLTLNFTPNVANAAATPPVGANSWTMTVSDSASGATPLATLDLAFNGTGSNAGTLASATGTGYDATTGLLTLPVAGGAQSIAMNIGMAGSSAGITQMQGAFSETRLDKDGSAYGTLQKVSVSDSGQVMGSFSNGASRPLYQLKLANVANPDAMRPANGDAFEFSADAGVVRLTNPGDGAAGTTLGNALESSNVDMNTELTNLIETQRAYSSNATVVRTADQMLQEVNNLIR